MQLRERSASMDCSDSVESFSKGRTFKGRLSSTTSPAWMNLLFTSSERYDVSSAPRAARRCALTCYVLEPRRVLALMWRAYPHDVRFLEVATLRPHDIRPLQRDAELLAVQDVHDPRSELREEGERGLDCARRRHGRGDRGCVGEGHDTEGDVQSARGDDDGLVEPRDGRVAAEEALRERGQAVAQVGVVALHAPLVKLHPLQQTCAQEASRGLWKVRCRQLPDTRGSPRQTLTMSQRQFRYMTLLRGHIRVCLARLTSAKASSTAALATPTAPSASAAPGVASI